MEIPLQVERPAQSEHINMILYGDSGSGKTHFLGTAQACKETSPSIILDFEMGTRSLSGVEIDVVRPGSWKEIQDIYEYLRFDKHKYKSVSLDSVTEIQKKFSLGAILGDVEDGRVDLGQTVAPGIKDWLRTGDQMRKLIRAFRDLAYNAEKERRVHVFMTALERINDKRQIISPQLYGSLGEECGAIVDFLVRLSRETQMTTEGEEVVRRHLLTDDHINSDEVKVMGKNRGSLLPKGIWEPTVTKIMDLLKGAKNE